MTQSKIVSEFPGKDTASRVAGLLRELIEPSPSAVTLFESANGWRIEAYFEDQPDPLHIQGQIEGFLPDSGVRFKSEEIPDENWVELSQAGLPPVFAGRFTIFGSHDQHKIVRGRNSILIDAGEAFGTAHHATTESCLMAIDRETRANCYCKALDLGCGTGVLAIAIARALPGARIDATDIDADSVRVARFNAKLNRAADRIRFQTLAGLPKRLVSSPYPSRCDQYDLVVANILAGPLARLAEKMSRSVKTGGTLILSGILSNQAAMVRATYGAHGFYLSRTIPNMGWTSLVLKKH